MEQRIILSKEADAAKKEAECLIKARNKACALIEDAKARYVKEKTRARSKKAALERDALANSPRFAPLEEYIRREDIQEAYGVDYITASERDRLEELWDEREEIKNKVVDGFYRDEVTDALNSAYMAIADIWEDRIEKAQQIEKDFKKQVDEADKAAKAWMDRQNEAFEKMTGGKA